MASTPLRLARTIFSVVVSCSIVLPGLISPTPAFAQTAGPHQDGNGWTVFTPSSDTRTVYVSNSAGNDTNSGLAQDTPVKTLKKGMSLLRNGYPDWLLLKKGDTWTEEALGAINISGRSATEPMLISSYGSGARPLIKTSPASSSGGVYTGNGRGDYFAIVGLEFYAYKRDPNSPDYDPASVGQTGFSFLTPSRWLLLEDNKFSFYLVNTVQAYPSGTFGTVSLRRNIITDNYSTGSHSQGLFSSGTTNFLLEENVWDHNGWNSQVTGGTIGAGSTIFNRNMYLSHGDGQTIVRGNIDANGASGGVQMRTGGIAENNLFLRDPISITFGARENPPIDVSGVIRNNVTLNSRDIDTQEMGTGIWLSSIANAGDGVTSGPSLIKNLEVYGNVIAHNNISSGKWNIVGIRMEGDGTYTNTAVHDNIIYDWTRATWSNPNDHRAHGFSINIAAASTGTSFYHNIVQQPVSGFVGATNDFGDKASALVWKDNTYWSAEPNPPTIWSKGWFNFTGATSSAAWVSHLGETGTKMERVNFPDPNRSIETYMASLGMTASYDAFMQRARAQSKDTWDPRFTAAAVNDYIRAGFGIGSPSTPPITLSPSSTPAPIQTQTPSSSSTSTQSPISTMSPSPTPVILPAPEVTLTSSATTVRPGSSIIVSWTSQYATSCVGSGDWAWSQSSFLSDNYATPPLFSTSTFTLTCTSSGGTASKSLTVNVATASSTPNTASASNTRVTSVPSGLSEAQIQAILSLLTSFNIDQSTLMTVTGVLRGTPVSSGQRSMATPVATSSTNVPKFTRDLSFNATGVDVHALQQYLNSFGFLLATGGPGSKGNETYTFGPATKDALMRFQKAYRISPADGYFGLKTRTTINAGR